MNKYLVLIVALAVSLAIATSASAQAKFKDVPDDHWAASAVYDLVRMGVSRGYPDGTFRGKNSITRYETAVFLSKLAKAMGTEDIKADLRALRDEIAALKARPDGGAVTGSYLASWKMGNLLTEPGSVRGTIASYRLKLSTVRNLGEGADVKVTLDTMDYGYYDDGRTATGGILATELLDVVSNVRLDLSDLGLENPVNVELTVGPGAKQHDVSGGDPAGGVIPSEAGITYVRPDTGVMASSSLWGMDVSGGYIAKGHSTSGKVQVSDITGAVGYTFEGVPLVNSLRVDATGEYLSQGQFSSKTRDVRGTIAMAAPLADKVEASGTIGLGGSEKKNWMVAGEVILNDVWDTGTVANISMSKVGSEFIDTRSVFAEVEFDAAGLDTFSRPLENGTVNLGGKITQNVAEDLKLVGKGDLRLEPDYKYEAPKGRLTAEGGISYAIAPNTSLDAMYRVFQDKSTEDTSDLAAVGLMYNF